MSYHVAMFAPRIAVVSAAPMVPGVTTSPALAAGVRVTLAKSVVGSAGTEAPVAPRHPVRASAIQSGSNVRFTVSSSGVLRLLLRTVAKTPSVGAFACFT